LGVPGLTAALYLHPPDEVVGLEVLRGTEKLLLNVPALVYHDKADQLADFIDPNNRFGILGVYVMDYDERMRAAMPDVRIPSGVVVLGQSLDFSALTGELHAGDIIHAVNRVPIHSTEQLRSALQQLKLGDPLVLQIERQKQLQYVDSEME
jgi:S1-C subfamily serine protease